MKDDEPFFIFRDCEPVTALHFHITLKKIFIKLNMDASRYSTSTFRSGRASDLLDMGVSVEIIHKLGHWKSNLVYTYLRQ